MKQLACVLLFSGMDEIDKMVSEIARHHDGSSFVLLGYQDSLRSCHVLLPRDNLVLNSPVIRPQPGGSAQMSSPELWSFKVPFTPHQP